MLNTNAETQLTRFRKSPSSFSKMTLDIHRTANGLRRIRKLGQIVSFGSYVHHTAMVPINVPSKESFEIRQRHRSGIAGVSSQAVVSDEIRGKYRSKIV